MSSLSLLPWREQLLKIAFRVWKWECDVGWEVQLVGERTIVWVTGDTPPCLAGDTRWWDSMFSSRSEAIGQLIRAGSPGPTVITLSPNLVGLSKSCNWLYYPDTCPVSPETGHLSPARRVYLHQKADASPKFCSLLSSMGFPSGTGAHISCPSL